MKKLIVAVALLLVATIALSVSAFGAVEGQKDYNLGEFSTTAPKLDGKVDANEYTTTYTLESAAAYCDASGKILSAAANAEGVTKSIKVSLAHDAAYLYIAIEATLGAGVADVAYTTTWGILVANEDEANDGTANEFSVLSNGVFVGEARIAKEDASLATATSETVVQNGTTGVNYYDEYYVSEGTYTFLIREVTEDDNNRTVNNSVWNAVRLTGVDKIAAGADFVYNTITIGAAPAKGTEVQVTMDANVEGIVTTEPATTEPATTEPATTEPATTEPATTEPATTEPAETTPAETTPAETTPAETTPAESETEPAPAKKGCKGSVTGMGIALVAILGAGAVVLSKKED